MQWKSVENFFPSFHFSNVLQLFPFVSPFLFSFHYNQFTLTLAIKSLTMLITIAKLTQKYRLVNHLASESVLFFVMVPRLLSSSVIHAWNSFGFHGISAPITQHYPTQVLSLVLRRFHHFQFTNNVYCTSLVHASRGKLATCSIENWTLRIHQQCPLSPSRSVAGHYVE